MRTIKKIMVAVDFSDYSRPMARYAVTLATQTGADLHLVNVFSRRDIMAMERVAAVAPEFNMPEHLEACLADRRKNFDELMDATGFAAFTGRVETTVRMGVPYQEILAAIAESNADILVMAAKGRSNLADAIVGSCAQKMFRRCPVPLLLIREKEPSSE